jgi:hypothetical protein
MSVRLGREWRMLVCQLFEVGNGLVVLSGTIVDQSEHFDDDRRVRIELVGTSGFSNGFLFPATHLAKTHPVPRVRDSIVGIERQGLLELGFPSGKIPFVQHFVVAQISMGTAQGGIQPQRPAGGGMTGPDPGTIMKEGETTPPLPMWYDVSTADKPAANKKGFNISFFLVEYLSTNWRDKARAEGRMDHPNTAMGIHAVWFAVHDAEAQIRTLRDGGFEVGGSREAKFLNAHGREVKVGQGMLVLLESGDQNGLLTKYLSDHDEGIIGVSIEVADLPKARQSAESGTGRKLETYKGFYGTSFLLPPEITHGVWTEMFQVEH